MRLLDLGGGLGDVRNASGRDGPKRRRRPWIPRDRATSRRALAVFAAVIALLSSGTTWAVFTYVFPPRKERVETAKTEVETLKLLVELRDRLEASGDSPGRVEQLEREIDEYIDRLEGARAVDGVRFDPEVERILFEERERAERHRPAGDAGAEGSPGANGGAGSMLVLVTSRSRPASSPDSIDRPTDRAPERVLLQTGGAAVEDDPSVDAVETLPDGAPEETPEGESADPLPDPAPSDDPDPPGEGETPPETLQPPRRTTWTDGSGLEHVVWTSSDDGVEGADTAHDEIVAELQSGFHPVPWP